MSKNETELGLPIEYQQLPEFFDAHNVNEKTEATNELLATLLKEQQVKMVLDMTCGTGSQVFFLHERGYEIIGSDFSPALLEIARAKAKQLNRDIIFIDGDIRSVKVGVFDAVITIFNAIGHLTKTDFEKALKNIRANLKDNGIYIFDIFNQQAITDEIIDSFSMQVESTINGVKVHNVQYSEIDRKNNFLISHEQYEIIKEKAEPETHTNSFSLQIYTAEELQKILNSNGFEIVSLYDMDGNIFQAEKSLNILIVAKQTKVIT